MDIFRHATLRRWSLNLFFNWIVNSLVYYSLSLEANSISSDPFFAFSLLAAVEIPSIFVGTLAMNYFGRKKALCGLLLIGGFACLSPSVIPKSHSYLNIGMAVAGKGTISATFALIYVYSVEIYPTVLRSTGLGVCSMFSRIGGIGAPYIGFLRTFGEFVPLYACGALAVAAGLLALDLPETHNKQLPQTVEDVDSLKLGRNGSRRQESYSERTPLLAVD